MYFGQSAHVFQGVELYRGRPIFYDTGDFIDDYGVNPRLRNDRSFLFLLRVERGTLARVELFPVSLPYAAVRLARGAEQKATLDRMEALSAEMGTVLGRRDDHLVLEP